MTKRKINIGEYTNRLIAATVLVRLTFRSFSRLGLALGAVLFVAACSDTNTDPDEGGIIGTGILLQGAVSESSFASNDVVDVKSADGKLTEIAVDTTKRFNISTLSGSGPWVLSAGSSGARAVYGIAYSDGTRNVNRFTDLSLRSWFARQSLDLDTEFESAGRFTKLPTASEYADSAADVFQLIEPVLSSYNVRGDDLIEADYSIDDQGVDGFLNRNTVLIENNVVKFVFTDPTTKTQTVTEPTLELESEFRDTGSSAPTVPGQVRAIGSESDEIIIVWDASTDDIAVLEYEVFRDDALIATTPYPVYIDSGLLEIKPYSYKIVAVDGANNKSAPSTVKFASPVINSNDVIAPPAPFLLSKLDASASSIQIYWLHNDVSDVVSFNVFRGVDEQSLGTIVEPTFKVTGTLAADTTVEENETYCYQVQAVDASGNQSDLSEILCVTASNANGASGGANIPLVEWVVPENLDALNCNVTLSTDQVQRGNTTLTAGCYSVPETITIGAGATLTLTEGVVLKFGTDVKLIIPEEATLTSNGSPESPVIMTGEISVRGAWAGIEFQGSRSAGNLLRGTVVQYAGGEFNGSAIRFNTNVSRIRMENTLVRYNDNLGLNLNWNDVIIDSFQGNRFTENENAAFVPLHLLQSLVGSSEYVGNDTEDAITIASRTYRSRDITIPDLGVIYRWNGVTIERGSLTIDPGIEFSMVGGVVAVEGEFTAAGTVDKPIVMKGRTVRPGSWRGFLLSGAGDKTFDHVSMVDAGKAVEEDGVINGAIKVVCTRENAAKVSIDNTDISFSEGWGILVTGSGCTTDIGPNNVLSNNALGNISLP